jgi:hypothetical protein
MSPPGGTSVKEKICLKLHLEGSRTQLASVTDEENCQATVEMKLNGTLKATRPPVQKKLKRKYGPV